MPMFSTFFVYDDWAENNPFMHEYYKCVLSEPIGEFKEGEQFNTIVFDMKKMVLELYRYGSEHLDSEKILVGMLRLGVI